MRYHGSGGSAYMLDTLECPVCGGPTAVLFTGRYCPRSCDKPASDVMRPEFDSTDDAPTNPGFGYPPPDTDWWSVYVVEDITGAMFGHHTWFREKDYSDWCRYYASMSLFLVPTVCRQQGKPGAVTKSPGHPGPYMPVPGHVP